MSTHPRRRLAIRVLPRPTPRSSDETVIEGRYVDLDGYTVGFETHKADMEGRPAGAALRRGGARTPGLPLPALLQLARVYGQAMAQIADAEVRLFHLYLHEPLMRDGVPGAEIAQAMEGMTREMLPFAVPFINYLHGRLLGYFVEQDVIGHIESDLNDEEIAEEGRMRVAIAFADLAGYTKLTEERARRGRWTRWSASWRRSSTRCRSTRA